MLMESRVEEPDGAQNAKKPRSVDLQTLYDQNPKLATVDEKQNQTCSLKRNYGKVDVDSGLEKKRAKKEILSGAPSSGKRIKKSLDEVYKGSSSSASSDLNKVESEPSQTDERAGGFDVISLNLVNGIHQIPKRKRDLVRRKKADAINKLKQEGPLAINVASGVNGGSKAEKGHDDENKAKSDQNVIFDDSLGVLVDKKGKRKSAFNGDKESRSSKINSFPPLEKESLKSRVSSNPSSNKKAIRSRKKMKETGAAHAAAVKDVKPMPKQFSRTRDNSLEDNEENLEENAAMMLSFRFDPSCTGFSSNSNSNCPASHVVDPLGRDDSSPGHNTQSKSDVASGDTDVRVLRPRGQCKRKGHVRKRRHFYEVLSKDVDAFWMVQKKIKVYWPLDQLWYFGDIIGYDSKKLLHHIKYDDREEEWIDLQNERFKLLLFPSEVPSKLGRRRSRVGGRHHVKEESSETVQDENPTSSHMESEPIISWLPRSSGQEKSSSSGTLKKPKTSNQTGKSHPSSSSLAKNIVSESVSKSNKSADKGLSNASPSLDNSYGGEVGTASPTERSSKSPIVYFRRRFRRKENRKDGVSDGKFGYTNEDQIVCDSSSGHMVSLKLRRFGDDLVVVNLDVPVVNTEIYRFKVIFLPFLVPCHSFGMENLWVFHSLLILQHGTLMTLLPRVNLEMLFVDNFVGLRFLLFEGSLLQAIALVFFVLKVFHPSDQQNVHADEQLPETSIRLQFSFSENVMKQLVFAFYNFRELKASRWVQLDHMLHKYCFLSKHLAPSDCTYNNVKALECRSIQRNVQAVCWKPPSSRLALQNRRQSKIGACGEYSDSCVNRDVKRGDRPPPFSLSVSAASMLFFSLHLKLLMEQGVPCAKLSDGNSFLFPESGGIEHNLASVNCEDAETMCKPSQQPAVPVAKCLNNGESNKLKSKQRGCQKGNHTPPESKTTYRPLNGITVEIPLFDPQEKPSDGGVHSGPSSVLALKAVPESSLHSSKVRYSLLGKPDLLCSGPKKPRTQVSYSLPLEVHDINTKSRTDHMKGFSNKRIRKASEKKDSDTSTKYQRNMESVSCDVNLLVSTTDIGWREGGATVVLEPVDDSEWQIAVKISNSTRYTYKVNQFLQSVSTNRYTHAMIWKGPKDWSLEFPDRSQWTLFKEMHEECYNRNFRAASVKNIPIPGVRLIEENDDHEVELPFVRPSNKYFRQLQTDVDMAMNPNHVLYDMDSDDEMWITKKTSSGLETCGSGNISDALFENAMDKLEKFAYAKQQSCFTSDELEQLADEDGPLEVIKVIYDHWLEKRRRKGMPLVRHLQPPHWEIYQQQVKKWESAMSKNYGTVSSGWRGKAIEKPPMFAFCLKPRGLEMHINRGTKHRAQKKLHVSGHGNLVLGDPENYHSYGRRFYSGEEKILYHQGSIDSSTVFSMNNDGYDRIHYPRLYRTKSRKIGTLLYPNEQQVYHPPHNQRSHSRRNGRQEHPEWPSPRYCHQEQSPRFSVEHLNPADVDEFRLRDASSAAQHAINMAKMKRIHAQRLLYRADLAIHKASVALMTADAIKACREAYVNDASSDG